jgi:putative tRNA adenosine deaminase-associated protein
MQDTIDAQLDDVDLAVAAYRRAGEWVVDELTLEHCEDVETLAEALRHLGGDTGAIALVSIDEDFFVIVRVQGPRTRVLLSDASAAEDWDLAESVLDLLDETDPDDLDERPGERRRYLGVDLVGGDLVEDVAGRHPVARPPGPAGDRALGDGLAELREQQVGHGVSRAASGRSARGPSRRTTR